MMASVMMVSERTLVQVTCREGKIEIVEIQQC